MCSFEISHSESEKVISYREVVGRCGLVHWRMDGRISMGLTEGREGRRKGVREGGRDGGRELGRQGGRKEGREAGEG